MLSQHPRTKTSQSDLLPSNYDFTTKSVLFATFALQLRTREIMFDMMKMMGKLGEVKQKMAEAQEKVAFLQATGEAGAGMVKATVTGTKKLIGLDIDPSLINEADATMLKDLIIAAVNMAQTNAEEIAKAEMKKNTEGMLPNIPGLDLSAFGL